MDYTTPYWIMWYMFCIIIYFILIPIIDFKSNKYKVITVLISIVLALVIGFSDDIGYYLSLSRLITFYPFFLIGYYLSKNEKFTNLFIMDNIKKNKRIMLYIASLLFTVIVGLLVCNNFFSRWMLYGSFAYYSGYSILTKLLIMLIGIIWCFVFLIIIPNKKLPIVNEIGKNTLSVYLLHGFIVLLIDFTAINLGLPIIALISIGIALMTMIIIGNRYIGKRIMFVFFLQWIYYLIERKKNN